MQRYKLGDVLGDGAFGVVYRAVAENGDVVAVKRMKRRFISWQQCIELRELKALCKLSHPNIIKLREAIRENEELFLIFEYCESNVHQFSLEAAIAAGMHGTTAATSTTTDSLGSGRRHGSPHLQCLPLYEDQVKLITFQVLSAVAYLHKQGFFHRDIKPENILCSNGIEHVKLTDFGIAREIRDRPPFTAYVSTRWYRAPEVLLHSTNYNSPVDLWAVGVLMCELFLGRPIFPGCSETDTLLKQQCVLGSITQSGWKEGQRMLLAFSVAFPAVNVTPLRSVIPQASDQALDLISALLRYDPI